MGTLCVTQRDYQRLLRVLHHKVQDSSTEDDRLRKLYDGLHQAETLKSEEIPADIVTMNSRVSLVNTLTGEQRSVMLVYPPERDRRTGRISILDPLGMALLGSRVGDVIDFEDNSGVHCFRVDHLDFQPEARGLYDL